MSSEYVPVDTYRNALSRRNQWGLPGMPNRLPFVRRRDRDLGGRARWLADDLIGAMR